jgi:hypothetical protein
MHTKNPYGKTRLLMMAPTTATIEIDDWTTLDVVESELAIVELEVDLDKVSL